MENLNLGNCTVCQKEFDSVLDSSGGVCIDCSHSHAENTVYKVLSVSEIFSTSLRA